MIQITITEEVLRKWQSIVDMLAKTFEVPAGFIVRHQSSGYEVLIASSNDENPYCSGTIIPDDVNIFCREVVTNNKMLAVFDATRREEWQTNPEVSEDGFNTYVGFPIKNPDGSIFGTICVMDYKDIPIAHNYISLLEQFRNVAELDLITLEQLQHATDLSLKDDLTGLYNRRGFNIVTQTQLDQRNDGACQIALVIIDIDLLKVINDQHGHPTGDKAIKLVAESLRAASRSTDIIARVGGDEFFVGLFVNNEKEIQSILSRARAYLEQHSPDALSISFSSGFCMKECKDLKTINLIEFIEEADKSLYEEKSARKSLACLESNESKI